MNNEDRELLGMAAKAAGIDLADMSRRYKDDWLEIWNPLTNDGDALRLAVKLEMALDLREYDVMGVSAILPDGRFVAEDPRQDPYAATRRAIVRAAALIGKTLK